MAEKHTKRTWLIAVVPIMVLVFLALMIPCLAVHSYKFTDEADNVLAGMAIYEGRLIYVDYLSQHMPLMYYICALFRVLGATTMIRYRFLFYALMAVLWAAFWVRNEGHFGWVAALTVPVFYCVNMYAFYASFILADHLEAWGLVALLFEFWRFYDTRKIGWKEICWISVGIFAAFGNAFASAFPIAVIVASVIILEFHQSRKEKISIGRTFGRVLSRYVPVLFLVLAALVVLFLPQILTGNIEAAIKGAYLVNRDYYSAYTQYGYGSTVLSGFTEPFVLYWQTFLDTLPTAVSNGESMRIMLCYGVNVLYLIYRRRQPAFRLLVTTVFMIMCASRAVGYDFHALPYFAVTVGQFGIMMQEAWNCLRGRTHDRWWYRIGITGMSLVLMLLLFYPYAKRLSYLSDYEELVSLQDDRAYDPGSDIYVLDCITYRGEKVIMSSVEMYLFVYTDTVPIATAASVPWMYDAYLDTVEEVMEDPPRVAVFDADYNIWGITMEEYCPEFVEFIEENYVQLSPAHQTIYVRKDYYDEARKLCGLQ